MEGVPASSPVRIIVVCHFITVLIMCVLKTAQVYMRAPNNSLSLIIRDVLHGSRVAL